MIDYRKIVEGELASLEQAIQNLDDAEPLDAQDTQLYGEMMAACSALTCVLKAFDQAEYEALDTMYAEHLRRNGERSRASAREEHPC